MGMAASQARFLGLTARKTNVEYQGQQVNQQRTALANESSGLFNQMTALKVPLPPSATGFYSSRYAFSGPAADQFTIASMDKQGEGYRIKLEYKEDVQTAYRNDTKLAAFSKNDQVLTFGGLDYEKRDEGIDFSKDAGFNAILTDLNKEGADHKATDFVAYRNKDTDKTYYILKEDLKNYNAEGSEESLPLHFSSQKTVTRAAYADATFAEDPTNASKYAAVIMTNVEPAAAAEKLGVTDKNPEKRFDLDIAQHQDDTAFDAAMTEYEFQKMLYDRSIQDINARTENIQSQDKSLELKLKQLDTEQKALQTEMDAVQKVIQKNVETTFKTFG